MVPISSRSIPGNPYGLYWSEHRPVRKPVAKQRGCSRAERARASTVYVHEELMLSSFHRVHARWASGEGGWSRAELARAFAIELSPRGCTTSFWRRRKMLASRVCVSFCCKLPLHELLLSSFHRKRARRVEADRERTHARRTRRVEADTIGRSSSPLLPLLPLTLPLLLYSRLVPTGMHRYVPVQV